MLKLNLGFTMKKMILTGIALISIVMTKMTYSAPLASDTITVNEAYIRAVPAGQTVTAAFMQLENTSDVNRTIVNASSPEARMVELHAHIHEQGMMKMRRLESLVIPAGDKTVLQPGGLHIMMIGLHQPLKLDQKVSLTLEFADGSSKTITAPVRKIMMQDMMK